MDTFESGYKPTHVANAQITDKKLAHYVNNRKRGGNKASSAFNAYLPRTAGPECERLAKEKGLL
jgi:hypothetical protein